MSEEKSAVGLANHEYLTLKQAIQYTAVSRRYFHAQLREGLIPWYSRNRRGDRGFRRSDLDKWVEGNMRKAVEGPVRGNSSKDPVASILEELIRHKSDRFSVTSH